MAEAARTIPMSERLHWDDFFRPWLVRLFFIGLGLLIGLYILGPMRASASDTFVPSAFGNIPTGVATFVGADGQNLILPLRLADTSTSRTAGFNRVGPEAIGNTFMLFALSRETTRNTTYSMKDIRAPLEVAVIDATGAVVAVQAIALEGVEEGVSVAENHRWLLLARRGALEAYGIGEGTTLDPESVTKLNF
jgi:uncharacterized membrane protein (UPF0127 family)